MNIQIIVGSVREGRTAIKVAHWVQQAIKSYNFSTVQTELVDLKEWNLPLFAGPNPPLSGIYDQPRQQEWADKIAQGDAFIFISPEYNHSLSPALAHLLNHFGSSRFAFKPSAIVTYSAGQWGGMRAGVGMRTFLAELGCLPVSAMVHLPHAQNVFDEQGQFLPSVDVTAWQGYFGRTFSQLVWWATATKNHRQNVNPNDIVPPFVTNPSERNAPN